VTLACALITAALIGFEPQEARNEMQQAKLAAFEARLPRPIGARPISAQAFLPLVVGHGDMVPLTFAHSATCKAWCAPGHASVGDSESCAQIL